MRPSVKLLAVTSVVGVDQVGGSDAEDLIEYAGRVDYGDKSVSKMGDKEIIARWIESGHESMIEMVDVTFAIGCSRVVSHELVRHRIASFQQESQRYVKYDEESPAGFFYFPPELRDVPEAEVIYEKAMAEALDNYKRLRKLGVKAQIARYLLPNAARTRIIMKQNLRGWRHFCKLRTHSSAQPEMQIIADQILTILKEKFPNVFADVDSWERASR